MTTKLELEEQLTEQGHLGAAWSFYYKLTDPRMGSKDYSSDPIIGFACRTIKRELAYQGFSGDLSLNTLTFGTVADKLTKKFQVSNNLEVDGVVGPKTARALFSRRIWDLQNLHQIPNNYLGKIISLESAFDPGAVGYVDVNDKGLTQLNLKWHPDITLEQAVDGAFCLPYLAGKLASFYDEFVDWEVAVAAWNVGVGGAGSWQRAGKPAGTDAAKYIDLVNQQVYG